MKPRHYLILSGATLITGMLFYGIYNELVIVHLTSKKGILPAKQSTATRKNVKLIYPSGEKFITEEKELLISSNLPRTLQDVVTSWLTILQEEHPLPKKVAVQAVMTDKSGSEAYISFDSNFLSNEQSTYQKLMVIEGLLKTFKENKFPITSVRFLVNYKRLNDPHLDFSHSWPVTGYLKH